MNATPMLSARWERIKALPANTARFFHVSAPIVWVHNPLTNAQQPLVRKRDRRLPLSVTNQPGVTYNAGRNAAKRERRALKGVRK
jgi:hypothetical protein